MIIKSFIKPKMSNIHWFKPLKFEDLLLLLFTFTVNEMFLGFGLLVKKIKHVQMSPWALGPWACFSILSFIDFNLNYSVNCPGIL